MNILDKFVVRFKKFLQKKNNKRIGKLDFDFKNKKMIPTEKQEGEKLTNILRAKQYKFTHIANEIGISGKVGMLVNKSKKAQGLSKGFPDYCIILKRGSLLFLELKRQRKILKSGKLGASPSVISKEQIEWIDSLNKINNVEAHICYGADEAIELIEKLEKIV